MKPTCTYNRIVIAKEAKEKAKTVLINGALQLASRGFHSKGRAG
jgi:hypothetical protein